MTQRLRHTAAIGVASILALAAAAPARATFSYVGTDLTNGTSTGGQPVSVLRAEGVNDLGHVVGQATFNGAAHPVGFFYDSSGHFVALNNLPLVGGAAYYGAGAVDINQHDLVLGNSPIGTSDTINPTDDQHAVTWQPPSGTPTDLGVLSFCPPGGHSPQSSDDSLGTSINILGNAVGRSIVWDCENNTAPNKYAATLFSGGAVTQLAGGAVNALGIADNGSYVILDPNNSSQTLLEPAGTVIPFQVA